MCRQPRWRFRVSHGFRVSRKLRQTEVQNLGFTARGDEDVCGLDIAMDDALLVRRFQRIGDLNREAQYFIGGRGAAFEAIRSRSVCPSSNGITMKGWPSCSPNS